MKYFILFSFLLCVATLSHSQGALKNNIIIVADYSNAPVMQKIIKGKNNIQVRDMDEKLPKPKIESFEPSIIGETYTWRIQTEQAKLLAGIALGFRSVCFAEPGDSIYIHFNDSLPEFSGKGAMKFQLVYAIEKIQKSIENPVPLFQKQDGTGKAKKVLTVKEYLLFCKYYDEQINVALSLLKQYKLQLSQLEYDWIKARAISKSESGRIGVFGLTIFTFNERFGIDTTYSREYKARLWDSTMNQPTAVWLRGQDNLPGLSSGYFYSFSRGQVWKKYSWDMANDTLASKTMRVKMVYDQLVKDYKGLRLEQTLAAELLDEEVTQEMGAWHPMTQRLLKDYYSRSKFPAYKKWVQSLEAERQYYITPTVPLFQLKDQNNKSFTEKDIQGKFAVIYFWNTECADCRKKGSILQEQQKKFKNDTDVVFLNVCLDGDKNGWLKKRDLYAPKDGIQLYTDGMGNNLEIIKNFNIEQYPTIRMVRPDGRMLIMGNEEPDLAKDNGKWLESLVMAQKNYPEDGPYVWVTNKKASYIKENKVIEQDATGFIKVGTDQPDRFFSFTIQKNISIPPTTYPATEKMLTLSDIEGNFSALRKLLQTNRIMDEHYNWTFGKGHLVFAGDMFDRGEQVTECLWLIYSLEEKAKAAGGMVHFILGNHEIMNLNGQDRYVKEKYKSNYKLLGRTLSEVYGEDSELGRWLRSKNIIEKIGEHLFCHGGISPHINNLNISLESINQIARPYYDRSAEAYYSEDKTLATLYNERKSPFWYRQYYEKDYFSQSNNEMIKHASEAQIDSTCQKFGVKHIITGHTIVADTISIHYRGKVINTDVYHAKGKSEALLIENNLYYRVDNTGAKRLLFKKEENPISTEITVTPLSK